MSVFRTAVLILTVLAAAAAAVTPSQRIAGQIAPGRVVLLGDPSHGSYGPLSGLLEVVTSWAFDANAGVGADALILALELDAATAAAADDAVATGDTEALLERTLPFLHLADHEFLARLGDLCRSTCSGDDGPDLRIVGPEEFTIFDPVPTSREEAYRIFVEERDQATAANLAAVFDDDPDAAVLGWFGAAHLAGGGAGRPVLGDLLRDELGPDRVVTITQVPSPPGDDRDGALVRWSDLPAAERPPYWRDHDFDLAVLRRDPPGARHAVGTICSRRVVEASIAAFERFPDVLDESSFVSLKLADLIPDLELITGRSFATAAEWRAWFETADYDGAARLESAAFKSALRDLLGILDAGDGSVAPTLLSVGFPPEFLLARRGGRALPLDRIWKDVKPSIDVVQAAGAWWCGDAAERAAAPARLRAITGETFDSPAAAMAWWRERYGASGR